MSTSSGCCPEWQAVQGVGYPVGNSPALASSRFFMHPKMREYGGRSFRVP